MISYTLLEGCALPFESEPLDLTFEQNRLVILCREQIVLMQPDTKQTEAKSLSRQYSRICYDPIDGCFWAVAKGCRLVFRLDRSFTELEYIAICAADYPAEAVCLDFLQDQNRLLLGFADCLVTLSKDGQSEKKPYRNGFLLTAAALSPCQFVLSGDGRKQTLHLLDSSAAPLCETIVYSKEQILAMCGFIWDGVPQLVLLCRVSIAFSLRRFSLKAEQWAVVNLGGECNALGLVTVANQPQAHLASTQGRGKAFAVRQILLQAGRGEEGHKSLS